MKPLHLLTIMAALDGWNAPAPSWLCSVDDPNAPPAPPAPPAPGKPPVVPPKDDDDAEPDDVENKPWMKKRLDRARKKQLKDLGFESEDEAKAVRDAHLAAEKAAAEEKRKQMSELDRLRADVADRDKRLGEVMSENEEIKMRAHLTSVFVEKGVKNHSYAMWLVTSKLATLGDDEELDERSYLDEAMKDPAHQAALGIAAPLPPRTKGMPITTVPKVNAPPPPPPPGTPPAAVDFRTYTADQMRAWQQGQRRG